MTAIAGNSLEDLEAGSYAVYGNVRFSLNATSRSSFNFRLPYADSVVSDASWDRELDFHTPTAASYKVLLTSPKLQ